MPPPRPKGHTSLSDLLADDVRDYFLREGVSEQSSPQRRSRSDSTTKRPHHPRHGGKHAHAKSAAARIRSAPTSSANSPAGSMGGSGALQSGWATTPSSSMSSTPPYPLAPMMEERYDAYNSVEVGSSAQKRYAPNLQPQQQQKMQQPQPWTAREEQFRGQHTAERHSSSELGDRRNNDNIAGNGKSNSQKMHQWHRSNSQNSNNGRGNYQHLRQDSSGSLQSRGSVHSRGSASTTSRTKHVSAADREFLRRYAEEKERTNMRMLAARPNVGLNKPDARVPLDYAAQSGSGGIPLSSSPNSRPYHSLLTAPRPPTVAGTHRPGLPSINDDDWEEDDRIERRDKRRMERKEARKQERQRRRSEGSLKGLLEGDSPTNRSLPASVSGGSPGDRSLPSSIVDQRISHNRENVPRVGMNRVTSQGSHTATPGSLCYSTGSSQVPFQSHARGGSVGTFVRMSSKGSVSGRSTDGANGANGSLYPWQETSGGNKGVNRRDKDGRGGHVRPLSYLSASSDSGRESGEPSYEATVDDRGYPHHINGDSSSGNDLIGLGRLPSTSTGYSMSSPHSSSKGSSSGTFARHPFHSNSNDITRMSSTDGSEALLGSAILDPAPLGRMQPDLSRMSSFRTRQRQFQNLDDDSSDGSSYDSEDDSDSSSYTSDSYDGGSSSNSSSGIRPGRYRNNKLNRGVSWEPVKFSDASPRNANNYGFRRDIEQGSERDRLSGWKDAPNYSSIETSYGGRSKRRSGRRSSSSTSPYHNRLGGPGSVPLRLDDAIDVLVEKVNRMLVVMELVISNMPSLVGSLALAWCSLGVDWFKWYEESFNACHPTHYHNKACVFTEFPGCFACDTEKDGYQFFVHLHYLCSTISFILGSFLVGKILIAFPVVRDELANPTTAAPLGLLCMAFEKVFAGNFGLVGESITMVAVALHTAVAGWFIFISIVYKTLPEPTWFSNTTGIGLAAAKTYLYWTGGGYFLSGLSLISFAMFYVVSLYRVHVSEKISTPVCWIQLSGPAVVLYGFTIFSQPGSDEDDFALLVEENKDHFYRIHRRFYMPILHVLFAFCMVSMASALYLLRKKWRVFREKGFSPAHVSFAAPMVSHANAMQAYRSSLQKFSQTPPGTFFKLMLYRYWVACLVSGTVLTLILTYKFIVHLPSWCQLDVEDDEMPPPPDETIVTHLLQKGEAADEMKQDFVSAARLQANESGALVRVLQDGRMKYVRSRRMPSMGFDPIMNVSELMSERDRLLQHVTYAADPSRDRGGVSSFDDTFRDTTFREPDRVRASGGRRRLNFMSFDASFMSFDASTFMRGDH